MKNKTLIIFLLLLTIFSLTACNNKEITDNIKFKTEYESLNGKKTKDGKTIRTIKINKNNPIIYKEAKDIIEMINNNETFIVYFGFAECPWCRSVVPTLIEVADKFKLEEVYYVDVLNIRDQLSIDENNNIIEEKSGTKDYQELLKLLDPVLSEYSLTDHNGNKINTNRKRIYAPNVVSIINGKIEQLETGISSLEKDPYMKLTKKMKKETYNKFKCQIKCIIDSKNTCTKDTVC